MKSTENNISNPLKTIQIDIKDIVGCWNNYKVECVTQAFYDLMQTHDPMTVYVISDSHDNRMYIGDHLLPQNKNSRQYLLGYDEERNDWIVYLNMVCNFTDNLIPIAHFVGVEKAINAMCSYNRIGSHLDSALQIFISLGSYISEEIGINETIIGIIACMGYRDDSRLQQLNEQAIRYNVERDSKDIPQLYRAMLPNMRTQFPDSLMPVYADMYDVFVKYDFFKDRRYHDCEPEELNLSKEIDDITSCFVRYRFGMNYPQIII